MITQSDPVRLRPVTLISDSRDNRSAGSALVGRLVQMTLALYLIPALMIVLIVGGVAMFVLMVARLLHGPIRQSAS